MGYKATYRRVYLCEPCASKFLAQNPGEAIQAGGMDTCEASGCLARSDYYYESVGTIKDLHQEQNMAVKTY